MLLLTALVGVAGCGGGGNTAPAPSPAPSVCLVTAFIISDPMTQPPAGSVGVATTIGSITVPQMANIEGTPLLLVPPGLVEIDGGVFVVRGASSLTAAIPKLQPNTTYGAFSRGRFCGPGYDFGQFTTGAT